MFELERYDAIIFDMDGTLVDSGQLHERAWQVILQQIDIPVDRKLMRSLAGMPFVATIKFLLSHFELKRDIDFEAFERQKERLLFELYKDYVKPTKLFEMIQPHLHGLPTSVGTGCTTQEAHWFLAACGLRTHMNHIVGCDQVENTKPNPDTFLRCAQLMNVAPERCLVFEDAEAGFKAARAAGMDVIDVETLGITNEYFL